MPLGSLPLEPSGACRPSFLGEGQRNGTLPDHRWSGSGGRRVAVAVAAEGRAGSAARRHRDRAGELPPVSAVGDLAADQPGAQRDIVAVRAIAGSAKNLAERVDRAVMNNDPAIRVLLPNLLEFTARKVLRLDAPTHDRSLSRRPARRSIEAAWRAKKASRAAITRSVADQGGRWRGRASTW